MKNRKKFWLFVVLVLGLVVFFDLELVRYITASREMDRLADCRSNATLFVSEYGHLRQDLSSAAMRWAIAGNEVKKSEFIDKIAIHERLISCEIMADEGGWKSFRVDASLDVYQNEIFYAAARRARFLPVEMDRLREMMEVSDQLAGIEREVVNAAGFPNLNTDFPIAGMGALVGENYLQLDAKFGMIIKDLKSFMLSNDRISYKKSSDHAAGHLHWVIRLGLIQTLLLMVLVWLGKLRLSHVERRAYHDALTDLPNRRQLELYLKWVCARAEAYGETVIVAFIDLNGFKPINDILGHERGDCVLKCVADRLRKNCRANDMASRYGGDEFVVVFVSPANRREESLARLRSLLHSTFDEPFEIGRGLGFGAAVGISIFPSRASTLEMLIETADKAMYEAKQQTRGVCSGLTIVEYQMPLLD